MGFIFQFLTQRGTGKFSAILVFLLRVLLSGVGVGVAGSQTQVAENLLIPTLE